MKTSFREYLKTGVAPGKPLDQTENQPIQPNSDFNKNVEEIGDAVGGPKNPKSMSTDRVPGVPTIPSISTPAIETNQAQQNPGIVRTASFKLKKPKHQNPNSPLISLMPLMGLGGAGYMARDSLLHPGRSLVTGNQLDDPLKNTPEFKEFLQSGDTKGLSQEMMPGLHDAYDSAASGLEGLGSGLQGLLSGLGIF